MYLSHYFIVFNAKLFILFAMIWENARLEEDVEENMEFHLE